MVVDMALFISSASMYHVANLSHFCLSIVLGLG